MFRKARRPSAGSSSSACPRTFTELSVPLGLEPEQPQAQLGFAVGATEPRSVFSRLFGRAVRRRPSVPAAQDEGAGGAAPEGPAQEGRKKASLWARSKSILRPRGRGEAAAPAELAVLELQTLTVQEGAAGVRGQAASLLGHGLATILEVEEAGAGGAGQEVTVDADGLLRRIFDHNHGRYLALLARRQQDGDVPAGVQAGVQAGVPAGVQAGVQADLDTQGDLATRGDLDTRADLDTQADWNAYASPMMTQIGVAEQGTQMPKAEPWVVAGSLSLEEIAARFGTLAVGDAEVLAEAPALRYLIPKAEGVASGVRASSVESIRFYAWREDERGRQEQIEKHCRLALLKRFSMDGLGRAEDAGESAPHRCSSWHAVTRPAL